MNATTSAMSEMVVIDPTFDFRTDTRPGKDPDAHSQTLKRYHRHLWSKRLPNGALFVLSDKVPGHYLYHHSALGEFSLASDSVMQTYTRHGFAARHPELCSEADNAAFFSLAYTIGAMMVFPGNRRGGKQTINQARGCHRSISDRMDLTLECIRRHYVGEQSPLGEPLARYSDFFGLFDDFRGYVEFFLLQDLVSADGSRVAFFTPFDDFKSRAVPQDLETYVEYRRRSMAFIEARNDRMPREIAALD